MSDLEKLTTEMIGTLAGIFEVVGDSFSRKLVARIGGMLPDFEAQNKKTGYQLQDISKQIEVFAANGELLENVNQTNRLLEAPFYEERIVQPMVRGLFPLVDLIRDGEQKLEATQPTAKSWRQYLSALRVQLEQFLGNYGIEAFGHEPNSQFDPKIMKPLQTTPTGEADLNGLVAKSLQCGFRIQERILRLETVSLFTSETGVSQNPRKLEGAMK